MAAMRPFGLISLGLLDRERKRAPGLAIIQARLRNMGNVTVSVTASPIDIKSILIAGCGRGPDEVPFVARGSRINPELQGGVLQRVEGERIGEARCLPRAETH